MAHDGPTTTDPAEALRRIDAAIAGDFDQVLSGQLDSIDEVLGSIDEELDLEMDRRSEVIEQTIVDPAPPPAPTPASPASPVTAVAEAVRPPAAAASAAAEAIKPAMTTPAAAVKAVLAPINAPLQLLPPPWRTFSNLVILTLLAWVPIVWAVVWLLS